MERLVKIDSTATREFDPDIARISVRFEGEHGTRAACAEAFALNHDLVRKGLAEAGVPEELMKDSGLQIYTRPQYRKRGVRFAYFSRMEIALDVHSELLDAVWNVLSGCGERITFGITYELTDYLAAREELLREAVRNGRRQAEAMADAAGCALGDVAAMSTIMDGSPWGMNYSFTLEDRACVSADGTGAPGLNPECIEVSCGVHLEWELVSRA